MSKIDGPLFKVGALVSIGASRYSFKVLRIIYTEHCWKYEGRMYLEGHVFSSGVITEEGLLG